MNKLRHPIPSSSKLTTNTNASTMYDLKTKVLLALNKLADRDTHHIASEELEKIAQSLPPEAISPFLSCILDTDKDQKSAVRKECVKLLAALVTFHSTLLSPHLTKMVASIVKRLKDPDSVVRDSCVDTMGVLASKLGSGGGAFVTLVRPLFEALGEQNKQIQSGSALCLARVIDNTNDPPLSLLQKMLSRTIKLLKNHHFMAKPAVIELNTSIIQAGGAASQNALFAAVNSIQDALKNSDWNTRKAASIALGEIASSGASCLAPLKASCIRSLESCRFDKVKPVRDTVLHALQFWKSLPGPDTPECSEAGSSIKENFCGGDYSDITSVSDSARKDFPLNKNIVESSKSRLPLSIKRTCQNYADLKNSRAEDWHIEIAVPKGHNDCLADAPNEESEGSSITKTIERMSTDITSTPDIGCEYVHMDDKQECSSVSNLASENFDTRFVRVCQDSMNESSLLKQMERNQRFAPEVINNEEHINSARIRDRGSLDSTITETGFQPSRGCCSRLAADMACIQKQLLEIENKQSNLLELLQEFSTGVMESFSTLHSKVSGLEHEVDRIATILQNGGRFSDSAVSKLLKQNQNVSSPRFSTVTPRPSVDVRGRQPSLFSGKNCDIWEDKSVGRNRSIYSGKQAPEMWSNHSMRNSRNTTGKDLHKSSGQRVKLDGVFAAAPGSFGRQNGPENKNLIWQRVKGFLSDGDLDSAYAEALCSGNELVLIEFIDITGPVLESLSPKTISDLLRTLATRLEQRHILVIFPWLQQVVDLSTVHGPDYLAVSPKARRDCFSVMQEAVNMEFSNPGDRRLVGQLALKLRQVWGTSSS